MWQFPNCIGAIDGKHIMLRCPPNSGSTFFNYKGRYSIQLLAVCDAHYRFTLVDVGCEGRQSDGGVLAGSSFGQALQDERLSIPYACPLGDQMLPYCLVGDEAFPLKTYLMRPFPGRKLSEDKRIFNYRLSRARRTVENAFGILAARWRIFLQPIYADPENAVLYTKAALCLHNFLRVRESSVYCPPGFCDHEEADGTVVPGEWRRVSGNGILPLGQQGSNRPAYTATEIRNKLKSFFLSKEGELAWQKAHVNSTGEDK